MMPIDRRRVPRAALRACVSGLLFAVAAAALTAAPAAEQGRPAIPAPGRAPDTVPRIAGVWQLETPVALLKPDKGGIPFTPDVLAKYRENLAKRRRGDLAFDITARCASPGMPRIMTLPQPFQIIQRADQTIMLFSWNRLFRLIHMTGDPVEALYPTAVGKSNGRWQGDTLIVETTGRDATTLLDDAIPSSEDLKVTERIRLRGATLEDQITLEDATLFTAPWTTTLRYRRVARMPDDQDICLDRVAAGRPAIER